MPCSPHRIPSGAEETSDTWDIAISAKQRNVVPPSKLHISSQFAVFAFSLMQYAHSWIEEHLPEDAQWFGDSVVLEHRYIWTILDGIQDADWRRAVDKKIAAENIWAHLGSGSQTSSDAKWETCLD